MEGKSTRLLRGLGMERRSALHRLATRLRTRFPMAMANDGAISAALTSLAMSEVATAISDIRDICVIPRLRQLLLDLMLKIALPILRKRFDFDCSAQAFQVVFLKSIKASDVGYADLLLLSPD